MYGKNAWGCMCTCMPMCRYGHMQSCNASRSPCIHVHLEVIHCGLSLSTVLVISHVQKIRDVPGASPFSYINYDYTHVHVWCNTKLIKCSTWSLAVNSCCSDCIWIHFNCTPVSCVMSWILDDLSLQMCIVSKGWAYWGGVSSWNPT